MDNQQCCPKFEPNLWENKVFEWKDKLFITDKVLTLFYMPINYGSKMTKLTKLAEDTNAKSEDYLCLNDTTSMWNSTLLLAVNKEIPGVNIVRLSGKFLAKVYEGSYQDMNKWYGELNKYLEENKLKSTKIYMWYTTCPKCAKKYGKNYTVLFAKID